jgi:hypothetical protein
MIILSWMGDLPIVEIQRSRSALHDRKWSIGYESIELIEVFGNAEAHPVIMYKCGGD